MKSSHALFAILVMQFFIMSSTVAGDFSWLKELDIRAQADSSGFQTTLATRFKVGNAEINAVFSNVDRPSDAYMILRLGELSHQSSDYVIKQYRANKNKGWGVLAKSLGIKPGSREFHALKAGHDLHGDGGHHHSATRHAKGNGGKNKSRGKNK